MNKKMLMWLFLAIVVVATLLLVDFDRYANDLPTDEEIDQVGVNAEGDVDVEQAKEIDLPRLIE